MFSEPKKRSLNDYIDVGIKITSNLIKNAPTEWRNICESFFEHSHFYSTFNIQHFLEYFGLWILNVCMAINCILCNNNYILYMVLFLLIVQYWTGKESFSFEWVAKLFNKMNFFFFFVPMKWKLIPLMRMEKQEDFNKSNKHFSIVFRAWRPMAECFMKFVFIELCKFAEVSIVGC